MLDQTIRKTVRHPLKLLVTLNIKIVTLIIVFAIVAVIKIGIKTVTVTIVNTFNKIILIVII